MAEATLRISGYREFLRAADRAGKESKKEVRAAFREVGETIRADATTRLARIDPGSAHGLKTRVRQRGVAVEQSRRKTTGKRPDYGALQMVEALLPALDANEAETERRMERAIDRVADHFDRGA